MSAQRFTVLIVLGLFFLTLPLWSEEEEKAVPLPDAIGVKEIVYATVIHSPKGFSSRAGRVTSYVTNRETLSSLLKLLSDFPAKGGAFKSWPEDIVHWRVYIHGKDNKVIALDIYGYSLQSPLDATFSPSANDLNNTKLIKLLQEILQSKKTANPAL